MNMLQKPGLFWRRHRFSQVPHSQISAVISFNLFNLFFQTRSGKELFLSHLINGSLKLEREFWVDLQRPDSQETNSHRPIHLIHRRWQQLLRSPTRS